VHPVALCLNGARLSEAESEANRHWQQKGSTNQLYPEPKISFRVNRLLGIHRKPKGGTEQFIYN
jgi:hypothetical protein